MYTLYWRLNEVGVLTCVISQDSNINNESWNKIDGLVDLLQVILKIARIVEGNPPYQSMKGQIKKVILT